MRSVVLLLSVVFIQHVAAQNSTPVPSTPTAFPTAPPVTSSPTGNIATAGPTPNPTVDPTPASVTGNHTHENFFTNCNHHDNTKKMICYNKDIVVGSRTQVYIDVKEVLMGKYHYCVTFTDSPESLSCTGFILEFFNGEDPINPLSPNNEIKTIQQPDSGETIDSLPFDQCDGFNLVFKSFHQNVVTPFPPGIENVTVDDYFQTCVTRSNSETPLCFGKDPSAFNGPLPSLMLGFLVGFIIATPLLLLFYPFIPEGYRWIYAYIIMPIILLVIHSGVLLSTTMFVVSVSSYIIGTTVSYYIALFLTRRCANTCRREKDQGRVMEAEMTTVNLQETDEEKEARVQFTLDDEYDDIDIKEE